MSPRRQPCSLHQRCVTYLSRILDNLCRLHETLENSAVLDAIEYVHNYLPYSLQATIGETIFLRSERLQQVLLPSEVQMLLRLRVRYLSILGSVVQSGVLEKENASYLVRLSLYYGGCGDKAAKLYSFLGTATYITHLQCTDFCNNVMMEVIANSCPNLYCLDLRGCDVTDEGILRLCGFQNDLRYYISSLNTGNILVPTSKCSQTLREIKFSMTKVTEAGVAIILLVLTNICLLRVPDIHMEKVFKFLQTLDHKNVQCNLKEFHSREILDEIQLTVLTGLCPNLEYIQVSFIGNIELDWIRLQKLTRLRKLRGAKFADVNAEALLMFLENIGEQIEHLFLYTYHTRYAQEKLKITRAHLQHLARCCPNLESFTFDGYSLDENSPPLRSDRVSFRYFQKLHTLKLFSIKLSGEDLKVFLSKSKNIEILELDLKDPHVLQDHLVSEFLDNGVWKNLIKVRISNLSITMKVMARFVIECPNLKILGSIHTWRVAKQQVADFKEKVRKENFDIEIQ